MRDLLRACAAVVIACSLALPAAAGAAGTPGSFDPSFASGGIVALGSATQLFGVAVENDGEIIAVGQSGGSVLVQCFGATGGPVGQFSGGPGVARAVAIQPDGKAVVAGSSGGMFVQRFNADCTPDASFDNGSAALAPLGGGASANALAIAPGGTIVVAGSVPHTDVSGSSTRTALARFNASGGLDTSFGSGGAEVIDHGHPYAVATAVAVQSDGKIVLAGNWQDPHYAVTSGWIERLTTAGADDSSFAGGSGVYSYSSQGAGYSSLNAVALQGDGRIVAAGIDLAGPSAVFVRLNPDGTPDTTFGSGGASLLSSGTFSATPYGAYGVGIAGGGRIVGAGANLIYGAHNVGLWALTPSGAPDAEGAFASAGTVETQQFAEACGMAVAPDGGLVVVSESVGTRPFDVNPCLVNSTSRAFVARYVGFGPPPVGSAPTVSNGASGSITEVSASVTGQVNPNGVATSYHFDYGKTTAYGSSTGAAPLAAASAPTTVSQALTGLSPATTYHYRLVASNADGTTTGSDATFTTTPLTAPSVSTGTASQIGEVSAAVSGSVNPNGLATSYDVVYGKTAAYGSSTKPATLAAARAPTTVSVALTSLRPATTYHYQLVATNADGNSRGADGTFKTSPRVSVRLSGMLRSYQIASINKSGLGLTVNCSQRCSIRGSLVIPTATVKRLRLGNRELALGSGSASLRRAGSGKLRLRLTRTGARLLAGFKQLGVILRIAIHPTGGGPTVTVSKSLTLDR